jgi:(p)ppGpp synthase/HD superfamily hydrolase
MPNTPITNREKLAWEFSQEKHSGQVRKFVNKPYFDAHVQKVNGIAKLYTPDENILIAALLHDILEDCYDNIWEGYVEIKKLFGKEVADIVLELTSDNNEIKYKYESKTLYLIQKLIKMSDDALIVKLSDRLQNISDAFTTSEKFRKNYFDETCKIIDELVKVRTLNRVQLLLVEEIMQKLYNISSIFKMKRYDEI